MSGDDELVARVAAAYQDGLKISAIVREFNVPPATVYWMLDQAGVAPDRMRRADRLVGNRIQMSHLYEIIEVMNAWIAKAVDEVSPELAATAPRTRDLLGSTNDLPPVG